MVDTNKKLPVNPGQDLSQQDARDLEIFLSADGRGAQIHAPGDFDKAKKSAFKEQWTPMGSYETDQAHEQKSEVKTSLSKETRDYNTGGSSFTAEASVETYVQDTRKDTTEGDISREVGGKELVAVADQTIMTTRNGSVQNQAADSDATTYIMSEGDIVEERSGGSFKSIEGDDISTVQQNYVRVIGSGDHATHVQTGNYDVQVTSGKLHLMASGNELIANSNVRVLLQVGPSSKISIGPLEIKLQVGETSYIQITPDGIKMVGPRIDLNWG